MKSIETSKVLFKFKGNNVQFNFNNSLQESIRRAIGHIEKGEHGSTLKELVKAEDDIGKRNKLIRIADKSVDGWKVVEEYLSEELASDSHDDKRIRAAQNRAATKRRKSRSVRGKSMPYRRPGSGSAETYSKPDSNPSFRRYIFANRQQRIQPQPGLPRFNDLCFACGKSGHWRRNCSFVGGKHASKEGAGH